MRFLSWNVNGLRACGKKGFADFLGRCCGDVLALQEVRALPGQLESGSRTPRGWYTAFSPSERPGYSGVAVYSRARPDRVETSLGEARFDVEGRFIVAHFGRLAVASVYFPKGSGRDRDNSRVPYKLDFYSAVFEKVERLRRRGPVYVAGLIHHGSPEWCRGWIGSTLVHQRDRNPVQHSHKGKGVGIELRHLGSRIAPHVERLRQRIGGDVHPGHLRLIDLLPINIQLAASTELFGLDEVELQLRPALRQWR